MKIITEIELRDQYKAKAFDTYRIESGVRLTPSAYEFLAGYKIEVHDSEGSLAERSQHKRTVPEQTQPKGKGFILVESGDVVMKKPEEYTHLKGNQLVRKNHPRIRFRGKLDLLESHMVSILAELGQEIPPLLVSELTTIFQYLGKMMRAEVLEETLPFLEFNGWTADDVRDRSHHPMRNYGVKHFQAVPEHGTVMAALNSLRAQVRELEIAAVDAFYNEKTGQMDRQDIEVALNRLSSLFYIMMCRLLGGDYR